MGKVEMTKRRENQQPLMEMVIFVLFNCLLKKKKQRKTLTSTWLNFFTGTDTDGINDTSLNTSDDKEKTPPRRVSYIYYVFHASFL